MAEIREFTSLHLFCGLGGAALGFQESGAQYRGRVAGYRTVLGIDSDAEACEDFRNLTGAPAMHGDLASASTRERLLAGATPAGRRKLEATAPVTIERLREAVPECPDTVFLSPPCKGFSGLLGAARAATDYYQALNQLVVDGLSLVLAAWQPVVPRIVLFENVPRIETRGAALLMQVQGLLRAYGYLTDGGTHCCGKIGGLAQRRRRYLLIARDPRRVVSPVQRPVERAYRTVGDVIGPMPMPGDVERGGPLHRVPKLSWLNWMRLSLIPAGGDWRDLPGVLAEGQARREVHRRHRVEKFDAVSATVTGPGSAGAQNVADPRVGGNHAGDVSVLREGAGDGAAAVASSVQGPADDVRGLRRKRRRRGQGGEAAGADAERVAHSLRVGEWDGPAGTVTGGKSTSWTGAANVADPRAPFGHAQRVVGWEGVAGAVTHSPSPASGAGAVADPRPYDRRTYGVLRMSDTAPTVTGKSEVGGGSVAVADDRAREWFRGTFGVLRLDEPAGTVTGNGRVCSGAFAVADGREIPLPSSNNRGRHDNKYVVIRWDEASRTILGATRPGSGAMSIADPRDLGFRVEMRNGMYGVLRWDRPAGTVLGSAQHDSGSFSVADPRAEAPDFIPVIVAEDGTWHRPMTTLELMAIQSGPLCMRDGSPLRLAGTADSRWRERIGNMVPKMAGKAIGDVTLDALLRSELGMWMEPTGGPGRWVQPDAPRVSAGGAS